MRRHPFALILFVGLLLAFAPAAHAVTWAGALELPALSATFTWGHMAPVTVAASAPTVTFSPVYRFFNKTNASHFYTASEAEKKSVVANLSATYSLDGVAYKVSSAFTTPLHRFFNKKNGSHFYTASESEKNNVIANLSATYAYDGPAYKVSATPTAGSTPVYRFFNKKNGSHFYTAAESEKNSVIAKLSATYALDGVAFHVMPAGAVPPDPDPDTTVPTVNVLTPVDNSVVNTDSPVLSYTVVDAQDPSVMVTVAVDGVPSTKTSGQRLGPLSQGNHRVRVGAIDRGGNTASAITSFTVDVVSSGLTRYEETDPRLRFKGAWADASGAGFSGGTEHTLDGPGSVIVGFEGTEIRLFTSMGPADGIALVSLDGGAPAEVDLYRSAPAASLAAVEATGLVDTAHTMKVEWAGSRETSSTGTKISFDAVDVAGTLLQAPNPLQVVPQLATNSSVTAMVTVDAGGTLELTGGDGTRFKLELPPGALMETQSVTMTRVTALGGLPLTPGLVGGVELAPSGLRLLADATLTVTPSGATLPESVQVLGYECQEDGSEFSLRMQRLQTGSYAVRIDGFSGHGVVAGTPTEAKTLVETRIPSGDGGWINIAPLVDKDAQRAIVTSQHQAVINALVAAMGNRYQLDGAWDKASGWMYLAREVGVEPRYINAVKVTLHDVIADCFSDAMDSADRGNLDDMARMFSWRWRAKYTPDVCGVTKAEITQMTNALIDVSKWRVKFTSEVTVENPSPYSSGNFPWVSPRDDDRSGQVCEPFPHSIFVETNQVVSDGTDDGRVRKWMDRPGIELKIPATIPSGVRDDPSGAITNVRFTYTPNDALKRTIPLRLLVDPGLHKRDWDSGFASPATYDPKKVVIVLDFETHRGTDHASGFWLNGWADWFGDRPKDDPPKTNVFLGGVHGNPVSWSKEAFNPFGRNSPILKRGPTCIASARGNR